MALYKLRRGYEASRHSITPLDGELIYIIDTGRIWVGDGVTSGGLPYGPYDFTGAGSNGLVPDPVTVNGHVLSDNGSWVPMTGGSGDQNIDCGFANSVFTPPQHLDAGGA